MDESSSGVILIAGLIMIHAILALAYAAISNARIRELEDEGNTRAPQIIQLITTPNFTITYQLLTTLLRFSIAGVVILNLVDPTSVSIVHVAALFFVAGITLILGDIVPEAVATSYANTLALMFVGPMKLLTVVASPFIYILLKISTALSAVLSSGEHVNRVTEEEIMTLIDAGHTGGTIEEDEKEMIYSVLQLDQTHVSEVMVPRIDVVAVDNTTSLEEAADLFVASGYSRIPVYEATIDSVKGLLYAKDLLAKRDESTTIIDLMRSAYFVPESKRADELLKEMKTQNVHVAIVVDEYGGTAGLVTIEDIIEEIIGDIRDEYDIHEEAEYEQLGPDEFTIDASMDLDDFNALLECDLPTDDADTVGGFIYSHFGRVPVVDDVVEVDGLTIWVRRVEGRRIRKLRVVRKKPRADAGKTQEITQAS